MKANALNESTLAERAALVADGMQEISRASWLQRIAAYGYRLDNNDCFDYTNSHNPRSYKARCVSNYVDRETGAGFAHYQGRRDSRFTALQAMRRECFVFHRGRIFEL